MQNRKRRTLGHPAPHSAFVIHHSALNLVVHVDLQRRAVVVVTVLVVVAADGGHGEDGDEQREHPTLHKASNSLAGRGTHVVPQPASVVALTLTGPAAAAKKRPVRRLRLRRRRARRPVRSAPPWPTPPTPPPPVAPSWGRRGDPRPGLLQGLRPDGR